MRTLLTILLSAAFFVPKAQLHLTPASGWGYTPWQPVYIPYSLLTADNPGHTWQLRPFASLSAGYLFLGGGISYVSAPLGIALYRPLNSNFTTFAAATVAPTAFHFSTLYTASPGYPGSNFTGLGVNAAVTGGIIYTNDARTFSISGSISVERGSNPVYIPPASNTRKQY
ncbi:MAG TPA: hypothetical protein VL978_07150 [Puia sp.]|nr:hypothetical protein [Puia sp.]